MSDRWYITSDGYVQVWTDGACPMNGYKGAKAGIGVFFADNNRWNVSEPVTGRATSNNAEIEAVTRACSQARRAGKHRLEIHTDSEFVINCITSWIKVWRANNWRTVGGDPVANREELEEMVYALNQLDDYRFQHVRGHHGDYYNGQADKLAKAGAERYTGSVQF